MTVTVLYPEDRQIPDLALEQEVFGPEVRIVRAAKSSFAELDPNDCAAAQPRHIARRVLFRIAIFGRARPCEHLPQHLDTIVGRLGKGSPNGGQHSAAPGW